MPNGMGSDGCVPIGSDEALADGRTVALLAGDGAANWLPGATSRQWQSPLGLIGAAGSLAPTEAQAAGR